MGFSSSQEYAVSVVEAHAERKEQTIAVDSFSRSVAIYVLFWVILVGIAALATWGGGSAGRISFFITAGFGTVILAASAAPMFRKWKAGKILEGINVQLQIDSPGDDGEKFGIGYVLAPGYELDILLYVVARKAATIRSAEVSLEATEIAGGEDDESGETVSSVEHEFEKARDVDLVEDEEKSFETSLTVPEDAPESVHRDDREVFWLLTARIEFDDGRTWSATEPLLVE
ncbi:MAG: hypothetical protein ACOCV2_01945 [Persicimonas sp.]